MRLHRSPQRFDQKTNWARVGGVLRRDGRLLLVLVILISVSSASSVAPALLLQKIVDRGIREHKLDVVTYYSILAIAMLVVLALLKYVQQWVSTKVSQNQLYRMRQDCFAKMLRLPASYFKEIPTGVTVSRIMTDPAEAQYLASGVIPQIVAAATLVLSVGLAISSISWQVVAYGIALAPIILVPAAIVGRRMQGLSRGRLENAGDLMTVVEERATAPGAWLCKLYSTPRAQELRFENVNQRSMRIGMDMFKTSAVYSSAVSLLGSVAGVMVYWIGGIQAISGGVSVGGLVAMAALVPRLYEPISMVGSIRVDLLSCSASFQRYFEYLDLPEENVSDTMGILASSSEHRTAEAITVRSLSVQNDDIERLHDINLLVGRRERVALVGPSGAGKSTLLEVMCGLLEPTRGLVSINGHAPFSVRGVSGGVGLMTQDSHFFHDSIRQNLLLCAPTASEADLQEACRQAKIWPVIAAMEKGLDTNMEDHGGRLSGGERQRLALARLLLLNPSVMLFDEPTAHLDQEAERQVMDALAGAMQNRTVVVATHRLRTVKDFDRIYVINAGQVAASGTHETLMRQGGWYCQRVSEEATGASEA